MIKLFLFWMFVSGCLMASEPLPELLIDADRVDYDGNKVILEGNVYVEHELGEVSCDTGVLIQRTTEPKGRFSFLHKLNHQ